MVIAFWFCFFVIFYTYIGYGLLVYLTLILRRIFSKEEKAIFFNSLDEFPSCTLVIAAYNEEDLIEKKIKNTLSLIYPSEKLKIYFVTDGSTDKTPDIVLNYPRLTLFHKDERRGKVAAMDRVMKFIDSEIVVFTDANTFLNQEAIIKICRHYSSDKVGGVAGEKRVFYNNIADASSAGEGMYWKYESQLKKWDSELNSVVGTAGELFSVRTELYSDVPPDTILDDFMISMQIAAQGYKIVYEPDAFATETASANITEELKRKIRIAAGGIQSIVRLKSLLNPFKYPILSFQYISHRVLRWTIAPILLVVLFFITLYIHKTEGRGFFTMFLYAQVVFYILAFIGWLLEKRNLKFKVVFIPFYFCVMNYAVLAGIIKYFQNKQSAVWAKAKRK